MLFRLKPSTDGALGMDDHKVIGTYATNLTNAKTEICQESNNTTYAEIIDIDKISVMNALTDAIMYTSQ